MRFALEPLIPAIERAWTPSKHTGHISIHGKAASVFGVSRGVTARWRTTGLTVDEADHAAVSLGCHPAEIWAEWFDDANANLCATPGHGGIRRHRKAGEPLCLDCAAFDSEYQREWRQRKPELERERMRRANARRLDKHRNAVRNAKEAA